VHPNRALAITARVIASLTCAMLFSGVSSAAASNWTIPLHTAPTAQARAQGAPTTPTAVSAACVSSTLKQVKLTWTAVTHASSYTIYQSTTTATGTYTAVATGVTTSPWTSTTLASGNYWYKVAASIGTNWTSVQSSATAERTITTGGCT
jgi:hypothetical protein